MLGPEGVTAAAAADLAARLPPVLASLEARLALPAGALPAPNIIAPQTGRRLLLAVDEFPAVALVVTDAAAGGRTDTNPAGHSYRYTYSLRAYIFVRGQADDGPPPVDPDVDATTRRNRYTLAVRETLHGQTRLAVPDPHEATIDLAAWRESYAETSPVDSTRAIGASFCGFGVVTDEQLDDVPGPWTPTAVEVDTAILTSIVDQP